jgi:hypothetical protein
MTPHESLSHASTGRGVGLWQPWIFQLGCARIKAIYTHGPDRYDVWVAHEAGGLTVGTALPVLCRTAREVLNMVRAIATDESADTTRIDHALAELREP